RSSGSGSRAWERRRPPESRTSDGRRECGLGCLPSRLLAQQIVDDSAEVTLWRSRRSFPLNFTADLSNPVFLFRLVLTPPPRHLTPASFSSHHRLVFEPGGQSLTPWPRPQGSISHGSHPGILLASPRFSAGRLREVES